MDSKIKKELAHEEAVLSCAREFHMVGDPTRLKICYLLCKHKELSVSDIADVVGVSVSAVSHTLRKLQEANMVESRQESRTVFYKLTKTPAIKHLKQRLQSI